MNTTQIKRRLPSFFPHNLPHKHGRCAPLRGCTGISPPPQECLCPPRYVRVYTYMCVCVPSIGRSSASTGVGRTGNRSVHAHPPRPTHFLTTIHAQPTDHPSNQLVPQVKLAEQEVSTVFGAIDNASLNFFEAPHGGGTGSWSLGMHMRSRGMYASCVHR